MWFKLSLLLFLIFCSCNVSSKNLRKSLNQKADGYGFMEDSFSPNAAQDGVKGGKAVYVPEKEYDFGDEAQRNQHHGTMDDSSNLNSDDGNQNEREYGSSNFESDDKHSLDDLDGIQHNSDDNSNNVQAELRQLQDGGLLNDSPSFDGLNKRQHGRFRRYVYIESGGTTTISSGGFVAWSIWWILVVIVLPILVCCCIIGCISSCIYSSMR
uniref:Uncharacterized protein n=1 Tax=Panagrolaimus davidi TaxID=227884 RepID=A0A914Q340_9BILA